MRHLRSSHPLHFLPSSSKRWENRPFYHDSPCDGVFHGSIVFQNTEDAKYSSSYWTVLCDFLLPDQYLDGLYCNQLEILSSKGVKKHGKNLSVHFSSGIRSISRLKRDKNTRKWSFKSFFQHATTWNLFQKPKKWYFHLCETPIRFQLGWKTVQRLIFIEKSALSRTKSERKTSRWSTKANGNMLLSLWTG